MGTNFEPGRGHARAIDRLLLVSDHLTNAEYRLVREGIASNQIWTQTSSMEWTWFRLSFGGGCDNRTNTMMKLRDIEKRLVAAGTIPGIPFEVDWDGITIKGGTPAWEEKVADDRFPNKCPKCNSPAYVGFNTVECSREGCK